MRDIFAQRVSIYLLDKYCGLNFLLRAYLGVTSNVVQPHSREERKSIGAERYAMEKIYNFLARSLFINRTFNPISDQQRILEKLKEVAAELEDDMNRTGWTGRTVTLKYKLDTYEGMFMFLRILTTADVTQFIPERNPRINGSPRRKICTMYVT